MQLNLADLAIFRKQYWKQIYFLLLASILFPVAPLIGLVVYLIGVIIAYLAGYCTKECATELWRMNTAFADLCLFPAMAATFMAIAYVMYRRERRECQD